MIYAKYILCGRVINPKESETSGKQETYCTNSLYPSLFAFSFVFSRACRLIASYIARLYRIVQ